MRYSQGASQLEGFLGPGSILQYMRFAVILAGFLHQHVDFNCRISREQWRRARRCWTHALGVHLTHNTAHGIFMTRFAAGTGPATVRTVYSPCAVPRCSTSHCLLPHKFQVPACQHSWDYLRVVLLYAATQSLLLHRVVVMDQGV